MNLIIFEDREANGFYPLAVSHPVYDLFYGCSNVVNRLKYYFKPEGITLYCRDYLKHVSSERFGCPANITAILDDEYLIVNAALTPNLEVFNELKSSENNTVFVNGQTLIGARLSGKVFRETPLTEIINDYNSLPAKVIVKEVQASIFKHLWDIVNFNSQAINVDIKLFPEIRNWRSSKRSSRYDDDVYVHPSAAVSAGAFIDVSRGPVVIDEDAIIEPRSLIQGPVYIGHKSAVLGGIIREGCSLGPVCKVGGELEESIILGYANKSHEGFIGHSYIGEWVNLGALTTNSDLKNNYAEITVRLSGNDIPTGSIKIGCFIGDHSKTGIGTLLNTGIVIGFCNNLYGGSLFIDKEIGHFKWGTPGNLTEFKLNKAIGIAQNVMARRGCEFTSSINNLFERIHKMQM